MSEVYSPSVYFKNSSILTLELRVKYLLVLLLLFSASTQASFRGVSKGALGFVPASAPLSLNAARVADIFGSFNFVDKIEVRFNPSITHRDARLSSIDNNTELSDLWYRSGYREDVFDRTKPTLVSAVDMFIVDNISACGGPNIIGCAEVLGNAMVVEEAWIGSSFGANLFAHELGHNMGLGHFNDFNIMNSTINSSDNFKNKDIKTINNNLAGLIQFDGSRRFIEVNPIFISQVPVPTAAWLFCSGLLGLIRYRKLHS